MNRRIIVTINLDKLELPEYEYCLNDLVQETGESIETVCQRLKIDMLSEGFDPNQTISESVKPKTVTKFKKKLVERIKKDIASMIEDYRFNNEALTLDDAISEVGTEFYTEADELADEMSYQVEIAVK